MTYTATDGGGQQTTTNLVINLEDVNDNQPKFELAEYRRVVRESDISFDPPLIIKATDADGPLQGDGKVFYTIQSINTDATVFQVEYRSLFLKLYDMSLIKPEVFKCQAPVQNLSPCFLCSFNADEFFTPIDPVSGELTMTKPVRTEDTENGRYDLVVSS